jgi:hypothetical protein
LKETAEFSGELSGFLKKSDLLTLAEDMAGEHS